MLGKLINAIADAIPPVTPAARKREKELKETLERMDKLNAEIKKIKNKYI